MMTDDTQMPTDKLVWITPKLDQLGTMDDVQNGGAQPPNDASSAPNVAAS